MATEQEPTSTDLITLTRHILAQQQALGEKASGELTMLLIGIQVSARSARSSDARAALGIFITAPDLGFAVAFVVLALPLCSLASPWSRRTCQSADYPSRSPPSTLPRKSVKLG